ncbi:MAG: HAD family hydrolase [Erysipelotrichaceae bacterium]|nr:HAD family hydrolase [Erysipelotrichaceae bacterium]
MSIKGVIFDLDGTLLDTIADLNNSVNYTFEELGLDTRFSEEDTKARVGNGIKKLIARCYPDKDEEFLEKARAVFRKHYDIHFNDYTKPYDGIYELISILKEMGIKIGVNSNKYDVYTKQLIQKHFEFNSDWVFGQVEELGVKPDPRAANLIIERMGLDKSEVLYVGDTLVDYQTGKNAGLKVINVLWGFRSLEELREGGVEEIIEKPLDLLKYID